MFAVLMRQRENDPEGWASTEWPSIARAQIIAEYSGLSGGCTISLVEIAADARLAFRELQRHDSIRAVRAGTLERGLDLARAMIEGRGHPSRIERLEAGV